MKFNRRKLKLCPCCGGRADMHAVAEWWEGQDTLYYVSCNICGLRTVKHKTAKFAAEAWNERTEDAP